MTETPRDEVQNSQAPTAPKIIVDSDWKEQVEKERAAASAEGSERAESSEGRVQGSEDDGEGAEAEDFANVTVADDPSAVAEAVTSRSTGRPKLPPPSFEILISMLFTQAISALGQIPNPVDGETSVDKPMAKHSIDMIEMLENKTKGNLSDDESKMIREALHALRMAFVGVRG